MRFSQAVIQEAWKRAGGRCECERTECKHGRSRCNKELVWDNHFEGEPGAWEAHHKIAVASGGTDTVSNCEILCLDCHKKTRSYGRHD